MSNFFVLRKYSTRIVDGNVSFPGLYGGLYGQNLPYKFKQSYGDFRNRNFKKSHRTRSRSTGPRSDLRPDLWSLAKFRLLVRSRFDLRQNRNRIFLGDDQGCLRERTVER
jgi:hypothetical protein